MRVEIFDVEHGFCALVTGWSGERVLVDCGHNGTTGWRPSNWLRKQPLDLLIITNYDQDHLSDFCGVRDKIGYNFMAVNFTISPTSLLAHKKQQGPVSTEMSALVNELRTLAPPAPFYLPSIIWRSFRVPFPPSGSDETNKHSLVVFMESDGINIVFPGDLSREGWLELLLQREFRECLSRVNVFVASHHGREDGFCEEVFKYRNCSPDIIIVSDGSIQFDTQRDVNYGEYSKGLMVAGEKRYTLSTRNEEKITIESSLIGFTVQTGKPRSNNQSPVLSALLSHDKSQWTSRPLAGLLSNPLRTPGPPIKNPGLFNWQPPRPGLSLADFLSPPSQLPKPSASLLTPPSTESPAASLLAELLRKRK